MKENTNLSVKPIWISYHVKAYSQDGQNASTHQMST